MINENYKPIERVYCEVRWFNDAKGYGLAYPMNGEFKDKQCFVHYSAITGASFQILTDGEVVSAEVVEGPKGPMLANVTKKA